MSRPAGIDIFEDKVLREEQLKLQRRAGNLIKQGYIQKTKPSRKELRRLQRLGVELPPELKKKLAKRKRKAKKQSNLKQEIARGFREQKGWERQRREKPEGPVVNIGEREEQAQAVAQAAAMGAAAAAALAPAPPAPAAPVPIVIHGVGGGGGGAAPPLGVADIDRIRQAVRGDLGPEIAGARAAAQQGLIAQAQRAQEIRQLQVDLTAARQEQADVRADVVEGRRELRGLREGQVQELDRIRAAQEGQQQSVEGLRGELGAQAQDIAERRAADLLAQREREQLLEGQQAQLIERFDRHHDEFGVAQQYADAMEQAERERLQREAERERQLREDMGAVDRRSQELVEEIRAAQRQQGEAIGERDKRAEARLNAKLEELGQRIGQSDAAREFNEAARAAQYPVRSPRRSRPGGVELERLRAEEPHTPRGPDFRTTSPTTGLLRGERSPHPRAIEPTLEEEPHSPRVRSPKARRSPKAGWKGGSSVQGEAQRRSPSPRMKRVGGGFREELGSPTRPGASEPPRTALGFGTFDWGERGRDKDLDRGKSVGGDERSMAVEQTRPERQLDAERLAPGLEDESATGGGGGSELLQEEAERAGTLFDQTDEDWLAAQKDKPKTQPSPEPQAEEQVEGGEGFRAGDVGREEVARLEQLGGVELSPEKDE